MEIIDARVWLLHKAFYESFLECVARLQRLSPRHYIGRSTGCFITLNHDSYKVVCFRKPFVSKTCVKSRDRTASFYLQPFFLSSTDQFYFMISIYEPLLSWRFDMLCWFFRFFACWWFLLHEKWIGYKLQSSFSCNPSLAIIAIATALLKRVIWLRHLFSPHGHTDVWTFSAQCCRKDHRHLLVVSRITCITKFLCSLKVSVFVQDTSVWHLGDGGRFNIIHVIMDVMWFKRLVALNCVNTNRVRCCLLLILCLILLNCLFNLTVYRRYDFYTMIKAKVCFSFYFIYM